MKTTRMLISILSQLMLMLLVIAGVFDIEPILSLFAGSGGSALALAMIPGGEVTEKGYVDDAEELLERDVDDIVVMYKPDRFPMTTMMQHQKSAKGTRARKPEWVEVGYFARSTSLLANEAAGTGGNPVTWGVDDVDMWGEGDIVYVPTVTVGTPATEFRGYVVSVDYGAQEIDVIALNDTDVPAVTDSDVIFRMSRAAAASDAQTPAHGARGITLWNFCQTFMGQFEIEKIMRAISTYMDDYTVQEDLEMYDFRNGRENSRLFGARQKIFDPEKGKDVYSMGGVELYMGQSTTYNQGAIDNNQWVDISELVFAANAGSEERLVVGGKKFISSVLKVPAVQKNQENKETELYLGVKVSRVNTTFGDILLKHHKGFDEMGREHDAFCLDMNHLRDLVLEPMQTKELDLDTSGQARVDATRLLETAALQVRYPDTHTIIKGIPGGGS